MEDPENADPDLSAVIDFFTARGNAGWHLDGRWIDYRTVELIISPVAVDRRNHYRVGGAVTIRWKEAEIKVSSLAFGGAEVLIPEVQLAVAALQALPADASAHDVRAAIGPLHRRG
jgi:hypothetical protein